jgi:hypothetical protein
MSWASLAIDENGVHCLESQDELHQIFTKTGLEHSDQKKKYNNGIISVSFVVFFRQRAYSKSTLSEPNRHIVGHVHRLRTCPQA